MAKRYLTTEQRKSALKLAYADRDWVSKVDKMPPKQIYAIFNKLKKDGIINLDGHGNVFFRTREEVNELKERRDGFHQITLDEYMQSKKDI